MKRIKFRTLLKLHVLLAKRSSKLKQAIKKEENIAQWNVESYHPILERLKK
tara:strand:+ start:100 stop:252 length:153 start_codon:yes stop_codon:yes gene_type:complete